MTGIQEPLPDDSGQNEFQALAALWKTIRKNLLVIAAIAGVVLAGTVFYVLGQTKIYEATATLQIDPTPPRPLGQEIQTVVAMGADSYWNNKEYYETQYRVIESRRIAKAAIATLGMEKDLAFIRNLPRGAPVPPAEGQGSPDAVGALLSRLDVTPVKDSRLVTVHFRDADPERARRVLAAVINSYLDSNVDDVVRSTSSASEWLRDQVQKLKQDLAGSEVALHEYKKQNQILSVSLDDQSNILREEMQQLNRALTEVRTRRENILARHKQLESIDVSDPGDLPAKELLDSQLLDTLRQEYLTAKGDELSLVHAGKGANHPTVLAARARVEETRQALLREIGNVKAATKHELDAVTAEAKGLAGLLEAAKQRAFDLGLLEIEYRRLDRNKSNTEKLYSLVLERSKESDLTGLMRFNNVRIVEDARSGSSPVEPRIPISLGIGLVVGLALGLATAVAREQLDRSLKSPEDVERELALPSLGFLPQAVRMSGDGTKRSLRSQRSKPSNAPPELLVHDQPRGTLAEAARIVRTNLMLMSPDQPYSTLLVTSSHPSEGKTTVASAIAIALAQAGHRVLLIDCDLRQSRMHRVFGVSSDVGVMGVTLDPQKLKEAPCETVVPNLHVLPVGPRPPNPAEVLQSEHFKSILSELRKMYDKVIIDSPPVSVVSDSTILAAQVDATVFVVRAGKTTRDGARKATRSLRGVSAPIAGVVVNGLDLKQESYYGGYYSKYYRYGGDDD